MEIKTEQRNWLQKYWQLGLAVLFLILFAATCVNSERQAGVIAEQTKELKESKKAFAQKEKDFKTLQGVLAADAEMKLERIRKLHEANAEKDRQIAEFRVKNKKQKEQLKNNSDYVKYTKEKYNTDAVVETSNGMELQKDIPKRVVEDLIDKDLCDQENAAKDEKLKNKDIEIEQQIGLTQNAIIEKDGALDLLAESKSIQKDSDELIKNQKKNIKQLELKNTLKGIAVPVALALGFAAGVLLTN